MSNEATQEYSKEWAKEEVAPASSPEALKTAALSELALEALGYVNESIRDRNMSTFSQEVRRAFNLYNAVSINAAEDLLEGFEGNRLAVRNGSKVVQNIIRQLVNDGASQLGDMLYPTDQDNYGLLPIYPARPPLRLLQEQATDGSGQPIADAEGNPVTHEAAWEARKTSVEHRVLRMYHKIDSTLDRISFGSIGRKLIRDGALTGTAILKGPYADIVALNKWVKGSDSWELNNEKQQLATFARVSVLDFLPDMSAENVKDCAHISVRGWTLPREMRLMRDSGDYLDAEVAKLLLVKPRSTGAAAGEGDTERLSIKDNALVEDMYTKRYEVFETWAEFKVETLRKAGAKGIPESVAGDECLTACVIHCQGIALKVFINPLESGDLPFSVWCWDEDPTSIFGKGIPILAENCQLIYNAVWRMILDHGGLSAVPMVGMVKGAVEPAEGDVNDLSLRGGKVWNIKSDIFNAQEKGGAFQIYEVPAHMDQFFAIMEKAEEDAYKLSGVTRVERSQQGVDNAPLTLGATQIFQNNSSVPRRRQVRDFDDEITKRALTLLYNWLMQFETDEDIKGPMEIEPRGSSVLMQREVNTQNLMQLYALTQNGQVAGAKGINMLREIQTGMQYPEGRFIETNSESEMREKAEVENPPVPPEIQLKNREMDLAAELNEANIEIHFMELQLLQAKTEAELEQRSVSDERNHNREMMKLQLMEVAEGNRNLAALQKRQDDVTVHLEQKMQTIKSQREIAAGKMLQQSSRDSGSSDAQMLTARARQQEADTKARELSSKLSGAIKQGV